MPAPAPIAPIDHPALPALPPLPKPGERLHLPLHRIGSITPAEQGLRLRDHDGQLRPLAANGYDHFGR